EPLRMTAKPLACSLAVAFVCLAAAPPALADQATAEALFRDGRALMQQNKLAEACSKFQESERQDPQLGTLLALADCFAKSGKTASEWAAYNQVAFEAKKRGDMARADAATKKAAELEPNLSKLTINAADGATPGLLIRRDGEDIGSGALGTAIPVDPGAHVIEATAPGYEVWQTTVTVGQNRDVKTVLIPALQKKPEGAGGPAGAEGTAANPTKRNIGFIVGGVGLASLGLGAVTGIVAIGDKSDADKNCPNKTCNAAGRSKIDSANTMALVSTIGFGVGIAAVGTGLFLVLTSRGSQPATQEPAPAPAARLVPSFGPQGGGMNLVGTF
ncbi:MAG TPA: hypothetical protein VHB21_20915, partial [Minicystis sp.]|nr:hypothetical protein [Minicystis sp.]